MKPTVDNISVIGLGKLGLCVAVCFASKGYKVIGVDIDAQKIDSVNKGISPIQETSLSDMLVTCKERLVATNDYNFAINNSDATFIVVNTPSKPDGSYSIDYLTQSCKEIGLALKKKTGFHLVVITSTVLPETTDSIIRPLLESTSGKKCNVDFGLCYNPEFIALGSVIHDFLNPDLVLIGESDIKSGRLLEEIYQKICENTPKIARMSSNNAELTKISLNSYVTIKISFANTLASLCEKLHNGNIDDVTSALGFDKRIGAKYLKGGLGFGGPCFPRDNKAFSYFANTIGCDAKLAQAADDVNNQQLDRLVEIIEKKISSKNDKIAVLGLTYKPSTNVVEASQSLGIALTLANRGHSVNVYDPSGEENAKKVLGEKVRFANTMHECIKDATICILATPWEEFKKMSPEIFNKQEKMTIIDCWRILNKADLNKNIEYVGLGLDISRRYS